MRLTGMKKEGETYLKKKTLNKSFHIRNLKK